MRNGFSLKATSCYLMTLPVSCPVGQYLKLPPQANKLTFLAADRNKHNFNICTSPQSVTLQYNKKCYSCNIAFSVLYFANIRLQTGQRHIVLPTALPMKTVQQPLVFLAQLAFHREAVLVLFTQKCKEMGIFP